MKAFCFKVLHLLSWLCYRNETSSNTFELCATVWSFFMELQEWGKYFVLCVMGLIYAGSQVNTDLWLVDMMWYCPLIGPLLTGCPWSWQLGGGVRWQQPESHRYTDLRCALYLFITLHSWRSSIEILTDGGWSRFQKNAQFLSPFYFSLFSLLW